ncbi:MAG: DNA internalization-related competence protein ComEC/Rec2 [Actinomycetota bacterium]
MNAWALPAAAAAFWAGLLAWEVRPPWAAPWIGMALGLAALAGAWVAAPRTMTDRHPLQTAGLAEPERAVISVVAAPRTVGGSPLTAITLLMVGLVLLGAGWSGVHAARLEGSLLARLAPRRVTVVGTLHTDPESGAFGWHATLDATRVEWSGGAASLRASLWLSADDDPPPWVRGDVIRAEGVIRRPDDPGFGDALAHKGMVVELSGNAVERVGPSPSPFIRSAQVFRAFVGRSIARLFPAKEAGLLLGLALGDASRLDAGMMRDFQASGLGHLLVVSGENVAMVLAPILGLASLLHLTRWPRFGLSVGTVVFFVVMTGAEPSVMRAGVMATIALVGVLIGRPRATGSILAAAVLVLLILDPWLVWSIGFQLSVTATAGMVALASPIGEWLRRFVPAPVALAAGTTLAAQLGVTPLLLFHFHEVPGVTIVANLMAFPAVSPALLLGLVAAAIGLASVAAGHLVAALALIPMRYLEWVGDRLAKAPVGHVTSGGGPSVLILGGALVLALAWAMHRRWRPPRPVIVLAVAAFPLVVWSTALGVGPPSGLVVRFFDVGQGDAALVTSPSGVNMLVDGGPDEEQVSTELAALGVKRLDVMVATHPHADHIIGLPNVLGRVPVGLVLEPGCPDTSAIQADLDVAIADEQVPVRFPRAGDSITVGDLRLDVLSPDRCWMDTDSDANNDSLVILLRYGEHTLLFGGEPEEPAQQVLLDEHAPLHAELLKVPHHGAATSFPEFFQAVDAELAVICVGQPNDYGHPVPSTLQAISATGAQIWRTDQHGDIVVTFEGQGISVRSDR